MDCPHVECEPVEVGALILESPETIGQICTHCLAVLPPQWGCSECEWLVAVTLCGDRDYFLGSPCGSHMEVCS